MQVGDIFYSVMQKDNCPFEKPRITKFVVDKIYNENCTHPIVATKTDKWGRHYCFKESQVYSTYEDAVPEKNEKLEKIRQWEKERIEWSMKIAEEQRKREKLEKNQKAIECLKDVKKYLDKDHKESNKLLQQETEDDYYIQAVSARMSANREYARHIDQKISELKGE